MSVRFEDIERPERPSRTRYLITDEDMDEMFPEEAQPRNTNQFDGVLVRRPSAVETGPSSNSGRLFIHLLDLRDTSIDNGRRERNGSNYYDRRYIQARRRRGQTNLTDDQTADISSTQRRASVQEGEETPNETLDLSQEVVAVEDGETSQTLPLITTPNIDGVLRSILGVLECPVCFEYVTPPIPQCEEGHLICSQCFSRLTMCPKCRSPFTDIRNRAVEKIAELIPYPCRNYSSGCSEMILLRDKARHEQTCGYKQYSCLDLACTWRGFKPELMVHMTTMHPRATLLTKEQTILVSIQPNEQSSWHLFEFDEVFHVMFHMDSRKKLFVGLVMCLGGAETACKFCYSLTISKPSEPYTRVTFTRSTHPEASISSLLAEHHLVFNIPVESLQAYLDTPIESTQDIPIKVYLERRAS